MCSRNVLPTRVGREGAVRRTVSDRVHKGNGPVGAAMVLGAALVSVLVISTVRVYSPTRRQELPSSPLTATSASPGAEAAHTRELKAAAKWAVGAAASVAAVIVAGVGFHAPPRLATMSWVQDTALILGALIAFVSVVVVLLTAAHVLTTPRPSFIDLAIQDREEVLPGQPRWDAPDSPLLQYLLLDHRLDVLGEREFLHELNRDRICVTRAMHRQEPVTVESRTYDPRTQGDAQELERLAADLDRRVEKVVELAEHWEVRQRCTKLLRGLPVCGVAFLVGIGCYLLAAAPWAQASPR